MWSSSKPIARNVSHLPRLAVANTSAPQCRASCTAAMPTPPVAACTSTRSPARSPANTDKPVQRRQEHHRHSRGRANDHPAGTGVTNRSSTTASEPTTPSNPITASPTASPVTPGTDFDDHPGALGPQLAATGIHAQGHQHIAEVDPDRGHRHPHLPGCQLQPAGTEPPPSPRSVPAAAGIQPPRRCGGNRNTDSAIAPAPAGRAYAAPARTTNCGSPQPITALAIQRTVGVDQHHPARMLRLRRTHQAPYRRAGQVRDVFTGQRDRAVRQHRQHPGLVAAQPRLQYLPTPRWWPHAPTAPRPGRSRPASHTTTASSDTAGFRQRDRRPLHLQQSLQRPQRRRPRPTAARPTPDASPRPHRQHRQARRVGHAPPTQPPHPPGLCGPAPATPPRRAATPPATRTAIPSAPASPATTHRVQRRIQQHRMDTEAADRHSAVLRDGDFGENLVTPPPHRPQALETPGRTRNPAPPAARRRRRRPPPSRPPAATPTGPRPARRAAPLSSALRMQHPARIRLRSRANTPTCSRCPDSPAAPDHHLHLHATGRRQHQRRRQRQLLDHPTPDLVAGPHGQLHEPRPGEQHHPSHRMVGQPRLSDRRQPARQHHPAGIGPLHHRAQQPCSARASPRLADVPRPDSTRRATRTAAGQIAYVGNSTRRPPKPANAARQSTPTPATWA